MVSAGALRLIAVNFDRPMWPPPDPYPQLTIAGMAALAAAAQEPRESGNDLNEVPPL